MSIRQAGPALVLVNANVLTLDVVQPRASTIVVSNARIAWVGEHHRVSPTVVAAANVIDCGGQTIVPGFIDAHCHVLAYAASLVAVDCSPNAAPGIQDMVDAIRERAGRTPVGEWIRATGYSEFQLRDKRHPTRWDLDRAAPNHPVRLNHRSGHACVLNSVALERVGISGDTEEPPGGTITRDLDSAEPNGLLLEMDAWLDTRIAPLSGVELSEGVAQASRNFVSQGVTSVMDATPSNSLDRWNTLRHFRSSGAFSPYLSVMPAYARLNEFESARLSFGSGDGFSTVGHVKIMLIRTGGRLYPQLGDLQGAIEAAHSRGFPVAIHAVEADAVSAAAHALEENHVRGLSDRIEHASECPPDVLNVLAHSRLVVVSQPSFLRDNGAQYLSEFGPDAKWLYRFKSLIDSGIVLAASSDAPVSAPNPLEAMHASVKRQANSGEVIGIGERLTAMEALVMHTRSAAYATCRDDEVGTIATGKLADLAVLSHDPTSISTEYLSDVRVTMTIGGGEILWGDEPRDSGEGVPISAIEVAESD